MKTVAFATLGALASTFFIIGPSIANDTMGKEIAKAREMVKNNLSDPFSARFKNDRVVKGGEKATVCGQVNMKNRMGGYNGYVTYAVTFDPATDAEWEVMFPVGGEGDVLYDLRRDAAQMLCDPNR